MTSGDRSIALGAITLLLLLVMLGRGEGIVELIDSVPVRKLQ